MNEVKRGIYGCYNEDDELVYIGSTALRLSDLEYNHRNWRKRDFHATYFRMVLEQKGQGWIFKWVQEPQIRSMRHIEIEEGALIRAVASKYNEDMDPYESSVMYGRYGRI